MSDASPESFEGFYARVIEPDLAAIEGARRAAVRFFAIAVGVGIAVGAVILAVAAATTQALDIAFIAGALAVGAGAAAGHWRLQSVATDVKSTLLGHVADYADVRFSPTVIEPPAFDAFRRRKLVPSFDRSSFEDLLEGERAGVKFQLYEAHLRDARRDQRGRTRYVTVFRGQLARIHIPQRFHGVTLVLRDAGLFNALRRPGSGLKRVRLVDPRFEKVFEVFGTDQVEARYLLTPAFMERLLELEAAAHGEKARAAFADGDLLVAIEGGDLFESGSLFQPVATLERARRVLDDVDAVRAIIDLLVDNTPPRSGETGQVSGA
ncbi:MAG: DUF3137 domain-containing protein [Caulobacterales bacterium]|nr:DUF3137 domain-containing protein [Caulobacterales bacterium]